MRYAADFANARRLGIEANATLEAERKADAGRIAHTVTLFKTMKEQKAMTTATAVAREAREWFTRHSAGKARRAKLTHFHERANSTADRIDRTAGIIRDVKILGSKSTNGRFYTPTAMREAARLYEGVTVHLDHPDRRNPSEGRTVKSVFGELRNVRLAADAVRGDLHYLTSHPQAAVVLEAAEKGLRVGLSHNADGESHHQNGTEIVESIVAVRSVDVVFCPATAASMFESTGHRRGPVVPVGPAALAAAIRGESYGRLMEAEDLAPDGEPIDPERRADPPEAEKADPLMDAAALATLKEIKKAMSGSDSPTEKILAVCELARRFKRASDAQGDDVSLVNTVTNKPIAESYVPQGAEALANAIR